MPDDQPSSAPTDTPARPGDDLTAVAILHDDTLDNTVGDAHAPAGGTTPNSPIDVPLPHDAEEGRAAAEAGGQAAAADPPEPGRASR